MRFLSIIVFYLFLIFSFCILSGYFSGYARANSEVDTVNNSEKFFVRPVFGISFLSNTVGQSNGLGQTDGQLKVDTSNGINAGLGFGYFYNDNFAVEVFWEYRSNESETTLADNTLYEEGNYASNIFYLNGLYYFDFDSERSNWQYYAGVGVGWVQEIDIDLETNAQEISFSGSGAAALQAFAGLSYQINEQLSADLEFRYSRVGSKRLDGENNIGSINNLDYEPSTVQLALKWSF